MEVEYDKRSKQVDVQALKETMWVQMQESPETTVEVWQNICSLQVPSRDIES